jgi:hypothetical protein
LNGVSRAAEQVGLEIKRLGTDIAVKKLLRYTGKT